MIRDVLLVGRDEAARGVLAVGLSAVGFQVRVVSTCEEAGDACTRRVPCVVVIEVAGSAELALARGLRAERATRNAALVGIAAGANGEPERDTASPFDAWMRTPVDPWLLLDLVDQLAASAARGAAQ